MTSPSKACCNVPPVKAQYTPKGSYVEIQGMSTYQTGPPKASTAILVVGDIFGTGSQVMQGADILAYGSEETHQYQVFVPDFLRGKYADHSWFPPDTPEKGQAMGAYFQGPANPATALGAIPGVIQEIEEKSGGTITKWAALGLCWGGKVVTLNCGSRTPFAAVVSAHPAMVDPKDAANISIPFALLASKDEDADAVSAFAADLKVEKYLETFPDVPHGFMAARGDLSDAKVNAEYKRAYEAVLKFL